MLFNEKDIEKESPKKELKQKKEKKGKVINLPNTNKKEILFNEKEIEKIALQKGNQVKKQGQKKKKQKEKRPQAKKSIAEILPISDMTDSGIFELKDEEGFFDIWQIQSKDIYSMNNEEAMFDIFNHAHFNQSYQDSYKIVSLNFPVSTQPQQRFIQKKIEVCKSPLYEKFLIQKLKELQYLEWGRTNREYFIFIYGESDSVVKEKVEIVGRYLQRSTPIHHVKEEKKIEILFKLYNQNAKLGSKK